MASSTVAPTPASPDDLNPEPANPSDRKEHHLPPKSYATAAHENLNGDHQLSDKVEHQPEGASQDGAARKHKKKKPQKTQKAQSQPEPTPAKVDEPVKEKEAQERDTQKKDAPKQPTQPHQSAPDGAVINGIEKLEAAQKATTVDGAEKQLVFERFEDKQGGEGLMSIETDEAYREGLAASLAEARAKKSPQGASDEKKSSSAAVKDTLVSGRRAGTGWERSGMRFAPLSIPLKRRLQTLILLLHTLSIPFFLSLFFFLCALPPLWPLLLPYTLYLLLSTAGTSGTLSHRSHTIRSLRFWSLFASYFPARLHRSTPLPPTRKYIFGYHPHGIISHGAFAAFATEALGFSQLFPGITNTLLTLDSNFRIPLYRDYILALGLGSVSRQSCLNLLSKGGPNGEGMGRAITIVVGGARESLDSQPHMLRLVLKRRQGFVKLAIKTGADLVPVLAFGENDLYDVVGDEGHPGLRKVQLGMKRGLGWTIPLFHARGVFNYDVGLMPYRRGVDVVVGRPIHVVQQEKPEADYVDEVHAKYIQELERLWQSWKDVFAKDREGELEIVE